ncbi:MAG TPA: zinc ribbon domain-containing protein [Xanthobacteraceae bacterium]
MKPSQCCPGCGQVKAKTLSERWHFCPCGHSEPRDAAAARVCLIWALKELQAGTVLGGVTAARPSPILVL